MYTSEEAARVRTGIGQSKLEAPEATSGLIGVSVSVLQYIEILGRVLQSPTRGQFVLRDVSGVFCIQIVLCEVSMSCSRFRVGYLCMRQAIGLDHNVETRVLVHHGRTWRVAQCGLCAYMGTLMYPFPSLRCS